ncbi:hypothetical protein [Synechococcus elongatus]|uniref:hypothetical protein n=1 Tax=Synechococcus elongatus TaxID=32046 RepID=UPI000F7D7064|nr:hypothetical protein [Synechococcus elongatus]
MPVAGTRILKFFQTPMGEEIAEGTIGGLMAGIPLFWQDNDPGSAALQTATAVLGGIGLGMAGRRVGAAIGRAVKPGELEDQNSMLANLARIGGGEGTTADAMIQFMQGQRGMIGDRIRGQMFDQVRKDAMRLSPDEFKVKHGLTPEEFTEFDRLNSVLGDAAMRRDSERNAKAAAEIRESVNDAGDEVPEVAKDLGGDLAEMIESLSQERNLKPVTGEEVGRVVGRFIGDEVGILGGSALGAYAAAQLGLETPKDREIRRLKEELESLR